MTENDVLFCENFIFVLNLPFHLKSEETLELILNRSKHVSLKTRVFLNSHFWNENDNFKMKIFRFAKSDEFSIGGYFVFEERNGIMMRPV